MIIINVTSQINNNSSNIIISNKSSICDSLPKLKAEYIFNPFRSFIKSNMQQAVKNIDCSIYAHGWFGTRSRDNRVEQVSWGQ